MSLPADLELARFKMIEQQIRPWDVLDQQVLQRLAAVRREEFVPLAHKSMAFVDMEIPLGHGEVMLAPKVEGRMLQDLQLKPHERVLEIGAGSGYMAALLALSAQQVISYEIHADLAQAARANLQRAGLSNVEVRHADGAHGASADGPFDAIVLSGSVAELPHALLAQLSPGGRLAAVVGYEPMMRATFVTRTGEAAYTTAQPWDTVAPRLHHFPEPSRFQF